MLKFTVGGLVCALPLEDVEEVTAMVRLTALPGATSDLLGVIDYHGTPCPVLDLRRLLHLPAVAIQPEQHLLVLRLNQNSLAVPCDRADAVVWGLVRPVESDGMSGPLVQGLLHDDAGSILVLDSARLMSGPQAVEADELRLTALPEIRDALVESA